MLRKKSLFIVILYSIFTSSAQGQIVKDYISLLTEQKASVKKDTIIKRDLFDIASSVLDLDDFDVPKQSGKGFSFSVLPLTTEVPGGGKALVTSVSTSFYLGKHESTKLSEVWFVPYVDFDGRYGLPIRSYLWFNENKWLLRGDMRMMNFPEYTWGLGKSHAYEDKLLVKKSEYRFYQSLLRQVSPGLLVGMGYNLDLHTDIRTANSPLSLKEYTSYNNGTENFTSSISSGLNFDLVYDTRENSINPDGGSYLNIEYRINPKFMGSDYWWHSLNIDAKKYFNFNSPGQSKNMIALWGYYWTVFNSNPPYFDIPSIGWDSFNTSARGFIQGSYRAKSLFYTEAEYRKDITRDGLLGFVLFANINTVNGPGSQIFSNWNPGAGAGIRIKVDKSSGTNLSLDYAASKNYQGVYLTLGEYF